MNTDTLKQAFNGGVAGAGAMGINVISLMWMRTTVNYQYKNGLTTQEAIKTLYKEGGIPRFYRGLVPALFQGPLSRFGDTAANAGVNSFWEKNEQTKHLPVAVKTVFASTTAAAFRTCLMPLDAMKTIKQVEGKDGLKLLISKVNKNGPHVFWHGTVGASAATFVGHYPWFLTYNVLDTYLPKYERDTDLSKYLLRNAAIGFSASLVSDTCSNSIRVIKTCKQSSTTSVTYNQVIKDIISKDGLYGLFFRGLKTKILSNAIQGLSFSVLWRLGQDYLNKN